MKNVRRIARQILSRSSEHDEDVSDFEEILKMTPEEVANNALEIANGDIARAINMLQMTKGLIKPQDPSPEVLKKYDEAIKFLKTKNLKGDKHV